MIPRLCMQSRITDREATPCTVMHLLEVMSSPEVQSICDQIKLLDGKDPDELARLKRQLPVITPHAQRFTNNERKNQNAIPSGLVMLDVDDVEDPVALSNRLDGAQLKSHDIFFVAITPSGYGLRVIAARQQGESLPTAQQRLANLYGLSQYDSSTKDAARASFVMPRSYLLYLDTQGLEFPDQATADATAAQFSDPSITSIPPHSAASDNVAQGAPEVTLEQTSGGARSAGDICGTGTSGADDQSAAALETEPTAAAQPFPTDYKGIPYADIADQLIAVLGGQPVQGERNNFYFSLVRYIRYICDFNPDFIFAVLPSFGLSEQERRGEIIRSNATPRRASTPEPLVRAIALAQANCETESDSEAPCPLGGKGVEDGIGAVLPKLPKTLDIICRHLPESFRPAMIIAALPVLGTLATRVRFRYLDHAIHSLSFFSMITAPAATGKSFIRTPINLLLTPINERDEEERAKQQAYDEERRRCKNRQKQPEDPHACPRNNGVSISIAKLLQLMTYAEGKHLIGIGEEIDTLLKSENAGAWSKKGDIYRLAFDNASYSQMYMSDNSFSTKVDVYYNLLITGTPNGMYRFFKDVEDGLVTRVAFASLPDMRYTRMPEFLPFSDKEQELIIATARYLDEQEGERYCPAVNKAIEQWLEAKRIAADQAQSTAMDTLRRRAAVIGFRAGYLANLLYAEQSSTPTLNAKRAADFALWVAEYVFTQQMTLFGDKFEAIAEQQDAIFSSPRGSVRSLLSQLPTDFQRIDLINLRARLHQSTQVKVVLCRWLKAGYISQNADGSYHKIAANYAT